MAEKFVNIDRNTPMLLPPDLRDWIEDDVALPKNRAKFDPDRGGC
jgi:hypothetical protein